MSAPERPGVLGLDEEALVACVSCGLCLPHCPTYRVTGREIASPRGRIRAMREVEAGRLPGDAAFERAMLECVQCRGCEAACPSSVPFGRLVAGARAVLEERRPAEAPPRPVWRRIAEWLGYRVVLPRHRLLLAVSWVLALVGRVLPRRWGVPPISAGSLARPLPARRGGPGDVWLFTGCVMDAWMRGTHRAALRLIAATGAVAALPGPGGDCCGALHVHAGRRGEARRLAHRVMASMPGDAPILVDSAGCGAALREYGELLGTPEAHRFASRVRDLHEWLVEQGPLPLRPTGREVVVVDPCHLRHVQGVQGAVHDLLSAAYAVRTTDDEGLCCGAGGVYSLTEPALAGAIRERKVAAIERAGGSSARVAVANPGCWLHLRAAGVDVHHPADLLAEALR